MPRAAGGGAARAGGGSRAVGSRPDGARAVTARCCGGFGCSLVAGKSRWKSPSSRCGVWVLIPMALDEAQVGESGLLCCGGSRSSAVGSGALTPQGQSRQRGRGTPKAPQAA